MTAPFDPSALRRAILTSIRQTSQFDERPPPPELLYVPTAHFRALGFDTMLVQGIRGSGKSLWWAALQSEAHRARIVRILQSRVDGRAMDLTDASALVTSGFGASMGDYPSPLTLKKLVASSDPLTIWRTVVFRHAVAPEVRARLGYPASEPDAEIWEPGVRWVASYPELVDRALRERDQSLSAEKRRMLILFDALDRTSPIWSVRRHLLRGLLMMLLDLRSFKHLRAKVFARPDMLVPEVTSFPDASKIVTTDVRLKWPLLDLYGLLWQHLANAPEGGDSFRDGCAQYFNLVFERVDGTGWQLPDSLRLNMHLQHEVFDEIAGPMMGRDHRRGAPYTWLPGHLADTMGQVSPRSFLAALRNAAEQAGGSSSFALTPESIKAGVQEASRIRVEEAAEDFPWLRATVLALQGLVLPCEFADVRKRWDDARLMEALEREEQKPQHLAEGSDGVRRDLEYLGILERMTDGRVNMPDVYRVGFGVKRKGGVRPVR